MSTQQAFWGGATQRLRASRLPLRTVWAMALGCALATPVQAQTANLASSATSAPLARSQSQAQAAKASQQQHEAQLNAIRQAILQATLDRPTRVLSSAWIDEKGALHESAHFQSEAQVRGVRVLSYLNDDKEEVPQVSAEVLPWGWPSAKTPSSAENCKPPPRPWRLPLLVQTRVENGFTGPQQFASQTVLSMASQAWQQKMQSSQRWSAQHKEAPPDSPYLRALTGPGSSPSGWTAEWVLKPHAPATSFGLGLGQAWQQLSRGEADWRWTLSFTLGQRQSPTGPIEPVWQVQEVLTIDPQALSQNPSAWSQQIKERLQSQMQDWVDKLDKRSACEPVQFHVQRNGAEGLQLLGGYQSGLRPGDRVLVVNPSHIPSQMLEPGATQHLALAQVVKVGPDLTELQQLAGPALAPQGRWMALPL